MAAFLWFVGIFLGVAVLRSCIASARAAGYNPTGESVDHELAGVLIGVGLFAIVLWLSGLL